MASPKQAFSIARDRHAVEGMPLTLIITMVVLAITVPLIFGSLRAYDRGRVEASLISEIQNVISIVQLVYTSGPGNSAVVDFTASPGGLTGIDYVLFGDEPGGNMSSAIRYRLQGSPECAMAITSPNVPMASAEGMGFKVSSGEYRIRAECVCGYISESDPAPVTHVTLEIYG